MSEQAPISSEEKSKRDDLAKKRKWGMIIGILFFVLIGIGFLIWWLIWGQFSETTDDAYVNGNNVTVTPQIDGIVTQVYVDNAQLVKQGQLLFTLDPHDKEIALEQAKASLAQT